MNWQQATPVENQRVSQIKNAVLSAADISIDRKSYYLVKGWLGSDTMPVVYGDSNCAKSFLALDIAVHIATGLSCMGHKTRIG